MYEALHNNNQPLNWCYKNSKSNIQIKHVEYIKLVILKLLITHYKYIIFDK